MKKLLISILCATNILFLESAAAAPAGDISVKSFIHFSWTEGNTISYCAVNSRGESSCKNAEMPQTVKHVLKVLPGSFVSITKPNWLVLSDSRVSLCVLADVDEILCTKVMEGSEHLGYDITYQDASLQITEQPRNGAAAERTSNFSAQFSKSMTTASLRLFSVMRNFDGKITTPSQDRPTLATRKDKVSNRDLHHTDNTDSLNIRGAIKDEPQTDLRYVDDDDDSNGEFGGFGGFGGGFGAAGGGGGPTCSPVGCVITIPPPPPINDPTPPLFRLIPQCHFAYNLG
ncbi:hypothetical protein [Pseudoduganella violacea]|uniref:Uncharacterized protein n=1 Tax=Pseudoduganella violacea TaxID=1715466 RepID=A0A7W5FRS6_9BURK|nr:hypothetical protein [Pseudoduganella violacea]MBB3117019.1 hypothetical protein [Pseudoduganella violacea]